ncbi:hypothetical protein SeMB42_g06526 [Synchytrium endobioticum]|uniref:WW domain-containing protein n=1 Tax=Synchytrium endobioticum TaxID=286115 RepID=A0A507CHJ1_9FUNG|nr:hypothetical protein SeMB42_g06526 [Synchytrium endobioticum]
MTSSNRRLGALSLVLSRPFTSTSVFQRAVNKILPPLSLRQKKWMLSIGLAKPKEARTSEGLSASRPHLDSLLKPPSTSDALESPDAPSSSSCRRPSPCRTTHRPLIAPAPEREEWFSDPYLLSERVRKYASRKATRHKAWELLIKHTGAATTPVFNTYISTVATVRDEKDCWKDAWKAYHVMVQRKKEPNVQTHIMLFNSLASAALDPATNSDFRKSRLVQAMDHLDRLSKTADKSNQNIDTSVLSAALKVCVACHAEGGWQAGLELYRRMLGKDLPADIAAGQETYKKKRLVTSEMVESPDVITYTMMFRLCQKRGGEEGLAQAKAVWIDLLAALKASHANASSVVPHHTQMMDQQVDEVQDESNEAKPLELDAIVLTSYLSCYLRCRNLEDIESTLKLAATYFDLPLPPFTNQAQCSEAGPSEEGAIANTENVSVVEHQRFPLVNASLHVILRLMQRLRRPEFALKYVEIARNRDKVEIDDAVYDACTGFLLRQHQVDEAWKVVSSLHTTETLGKPNVTSVIVLNMKISICSAAIVPHTTNTENLVWVSRLRQTLLDQPLDDFKKLTIKDSVRLLTTVIHTHGVRTPDGNHNDVMARAVAIIQACFGQWVLKTRRVFEKIDRHGDRLLDFEKRDRLELLQCCLLCLDPKMRDLFIVNCELDANEFEERVVEQQDQSQCGTEEDKPRLDMIEQVRSVLSSYADYSGYDDAEKKEPIDEPVEDDRLSRRQKFNGDDRNMHRPNSSFSDYRSSRGGKVKGVTAGSSDSGNRRPDAVAAAITANSQITDKMSFLFKKKPKPQAPTLNGYNNTSHYPLPGQPYQQAQAAYPPPPPPASATPHPSTDGRGPLPDGWVADWSLQYQRWFFHNIKTNQSSWDDPRGLPTMAAPTSQPAPYPTQPQPPQQPPPYSAHQPQPYSPQGHYPGQQQPQGYYPGQQQPSQGYSTGQQQPLHGYSPSQQQPPQGYSPGQPQQPQGYPPGQPPPPQGYYPGQQQPQHGNYPGQQQPQQGYYPGQQQSQQGYYPGQQQPQVMPAQRPNGGGMGGALGGAALGGAGGLLTGMLLSHALSGSHHSYGTPHRDAPPPEAAATPSDANGGTGDFIQQPAGPGPDFVQEPTGPTAFFGGSTAGDGFDSGDITSGDFDGGDFDGGDFGGGDY